MAKMFLRGIRVTAISAQAGVTKQRVSQILKSYFRLHPDELPIGDTEEALSKRLHVSLTRLSTLRREGQVNVIQFGRAFIYPEGSVEVLRNILFQKRCQICGQRILDKGRIYCADCRAQKEHNNYPFLSEESRKKHNLSSRMWQKKNLGKARSIQTVANRNRREKNKAKAIYTVCYNNLSGIPIGTKIQVVRYEKQGQRFILDDGRTIPIRCVRISYSRYIICAPRSLPSGPGCHH